jgi:HlyD family secretion protein
MKRLTGAALAAMLLTGACSRGKTETAPRASGYVEATEVRIASKVGGRVDTVTAAEGQTVTPGQVLATIATTDLDLSAQRVKAERDQAVTQLQLVQAGPRREDIRQSEAQVAAAASDKTTAEVELANARTDEARFDQLLKARAGTEKQRDDASARRAQADARVKAAEERTRVATAALERVKAGARPEEVAAARARVAAVDAQLAQLEQTRKDATVVAPSAGEIASRLVEPGELIAAGTPLFVVMDLTRAWVNGYIEEPLVPRLRLEQPATIKTDAGDQLAGRITFISSRPEFTPRNVQTAAERAKLVYRVKIAVDNSKGILKPGMPVEILLTTGGR